MNIKLDTKEYVLREIVVEVDNEGFLQSHIRLYHKDQNPIEAKTYKYVVKLPTTEVLELIGNRVSFSSQLGETR